MFEINLFNKLRKFFEYNPVAKGKPSTEEDVLIIQQQLDLVLNDEFKKFYNEFWGLCYR